MFGDYGDKYISGGILIWWAKDWYINYTDMLEYRYPSKLAGINIKCLSVVWNKFENLIVPLGCVVDYYGIRFECQSYVPLTTSSLVYGSDNEGLSVESKDGVHLAIEISQKLNLRPHMFWTRGTS